MNIAGSTIGIRFAWVGANSLRWRGASKVSVEIKLAYLHVTPAKQTSQSMWFFFNFNCSFLELNG